MQVFGQRIIILNSHEHAVNLLNERSAIYSDRQTLTLAGKMVGWENILVLRRYGPDFREIRQLFHQFIGTRAKVTQYYPCVDAKTTRFLVQLLRQPEDFAKHIRKSARVFAYAFPHVLTNIDIYRTAGAIIVVSPRR